MQGRKSEGLEGQPSFFGDNMDIDVIEDKITDIFNKAQCTNDTLWYDDHTTPFEAISNMIRDEIRLNLGI